MKKVSLLSIISAMLMITALHFYAPAQQVEQIDIQSLSIFQSGFSEFEATIKYVNAAQNTITFNGSTNFGLSFTGGTVKIPSLLDTDGFDNFGIVSSAPGGGDYRFRFYVSASDSDPIALRPTILRKRNPLVFTSATGVRGRVELIDQRSLPSKIIAVDPDFVLTGGYRAEFTQCGACAVRTARYRGIRYDFIQARQF